MKLYVKRDRENREKEPANRNAGSRLRNSWVLWGIGVSLAGAVILSFFYGTLQSNAQKWHNNILEQTDNVSWLYQSSYLLYKDLCNAQNESQLEYEDIYLKPNEGYEWMLDATELEKRSEDDALEIQGELMNLKAYFENLEGEFRTLNNIYDYIIRDESTGKYITNMSDEEAEGVLDDIESYNRYFLLTFRFDNAGNVSVGRVLSDNSDRLRKAANEVVRENTLSSLISSTLEGFIQYGDVEGPKNCTVVYAASADSLSNANSYYSLNDQVYNNLKYMENGSGVSVEAYRAVGISGILLLCMSVFTLLGLFLPVTGKEEPWNRNRLCALPFEIIFIIGICLFAATSLIESHIVFVASGMAEEALTNNLWVSPDGAWFFTQAYNLAVMTLFFFAFWYIGICARAVKEKGIMNYIKERCLIYRIFPFMKSRAFGIYDAVAHLDLTKDAHKTIIKMILVNAVVVFIINLFWVGGFFFTVVYSILLYFILRKYVSDLQKKYSILLKATNEMAEGNLNIAIDEDLGVFEPFKPQIIKIQKGFRKAVDEEVKSQKMKAELITNVSHDLKTPLTAIITYVNLLKEENITKEQSKEYLDVLERKSLRLKVLIEDLFEVSKANSGNITFNLTEVDIINLIKQVSFEMSDKLEAAGLDVRMNLTDEKIMLSLDSQKTYRIYENLFGNIAKYALKGTRVYVNGFRLDDTVIITLKNISAQEISVDSTELTERFVRGDISRNTEGSGLGLAIAKSFTELQGGEFSLEVDGDLFKVTTKWH